MESPRMVHYRVHNLFENLGKSCGSISLSLEIKVC